jgi:uncharacterized membrane protein YkvA (DUF1232 family)
MSNRPDKNIIKPQGGIFNELMIRIKLVFRLMADRRVNVLYKAIPVASLIYLVAPTDLIPLVPVDDALVIWLATYLFVELAPPDVVQEHLNELRRVVDISWNGENTGDSNNETIDEDVVDAEFLEVKD